MHLQVMTMKIWYALLMALALLCAAPASAYNVHWPNSWDSAGTGTWEYKEVYRMCEEKKSPRYDTSYFENGARLSRYELAGVIIDLLDNGQNLTRDDWESLKKMRQSYHRELEARGWKGHPRPGRDPVLEIHGDLRVRHKSGGNSDGGNDARARVGVTYHVNDRTSINAGHVAESD